MTRRRRRAGPPGWAVARDVLVAALPAIGAAPETVGRVRFLGDGLYYDAYSATCDVGGNELAVVVRLPSLRAPDKGKAMDRARREDAILRYLEQHTLVVSVPRMIAAVPARDGLAIVQTAVEGLPVDMRASRSRLISPWEAVATAAAACHALDGEELRGVIPTFPTHRDHARNELTVLDELDISHADEIRSWAHAHLPAEEPSVFLHGDLLGQNLLLSIDEETPLGVIDWHCAAIGDPAYDLAIATRGARRPFQTEGGRTKLLDAYENRSGRRLSRNHIGLYELALRATLYLHVQRDPDSSREHVRNEQTALDNFVRRLIADT